MFVFFVLLYDVRAISKLSVLMKMRLRMSHRCRVCSKNKTNEILLPPAIAWREILTQIAVFSKNIFFIKNRYFYTSYERMCQFTRKISLHATARHLLYSYPHVNNRFLVPPFPSTSSSSADLGVVIKTLNDQPSLL